MSERTEPPYIDPSLMTPEEALRSAETHRTMLEAIMLGPANMRVQALVIYLAGEMRRCYVQGALAAVAALDQQDVFVEVRGLEPGWDDWPPNPPGLDQ